MQTCRQDRRYGVEADMSDATRAREVLGEAQQAAQAALRRSRASWFPLVVFGVIILGALPLFVEPPMGDGGMSSSDSFPSGFLGGWFLADFGKWVSLYWLVSLPLGYLATVLYFRRRAERAGVASRSTGLVVTGVGLLGLLVLAGLGLLGFLGGMIFFPMLVLRGLAPLLTVAVGLIVLAVAERNRALTGISLVFLALSLLVGLYNVENVLYRIGWDFSYRYSNWPSLILPGAFLLISGLVLRRTQRVS
jgi:hypothetical protein